MDTDAVVVFVTDTHCGQRYGLAAPGTRLHYSAQETTVELQLSGWSHWLWHDVWLPGIERVRDFAAGYRTIIVHGGDVTHGSRFQETLYSPIVDHQVEIAAAALRPLHDALQPDAWLFAHGTGAHDYGENTATRMVAGRVGAWGVRTIVDDHFAASIGGALVDIAHHGPGVSSKPDRITSSARRYLIERVMTAVMRGERPPSVILRGHVHRPAYAIEHLPVRGMQHAAHIVIGAPMCGPNEYARKIARAPERVACGFWALRIQRGRVTAVMRHIVERDTRHHIVL